MIRMIISPTISTEPYRTATIVNFFFLRILFSSSLSGSISDLTARVAAYFVLSSKSLECEAERIVN